MSLKCYSFAAYFSKSYLAKTVNLNQLVMWLQKDKKKDIRCESESRTQL